MGTSSLRLGLFALVAAGACSDNSGCNTQPLPNGALPADQTVEGGAQIRVTSQGFTKLKNIVPGLINDQIGQGFCLPEGTQYSVHYCYENQNQCTRGCDIDIALNGVSFRASNSYTLTIHIDVDVDGTIPADAPFFDPCYIYVNGSGSARVQGDADIELHPDPASGELTVTLARIYNLDLSNVNLSGSGGFCSGASSFADFLKDYFEQEIANYLRPRLNQLIQDFIPDPLGLEGVVDVGPLIESISPGTEGALEARIVPGGFAQLDTTTNGGIALGVITGINSDEDPSTRSIDLDNEPALCVPPIPAPDLAASPFSLGKNAQRGTYEIAAAPGFLTDAPGADLSIGVSTTTLRQIGHHAVTSGVMCMGIGTAVVPQLDVGTFGILVPSVAELGSEDGTDPVMIVTRPQTRVDFTIGDNTPTSPAITIHLRDFELDVYPFLYERYIRAFTMSTTLDLGINLEFDKPVDGPWRVKPILVGLGASAVDVTVLNSQFLAEDIPQLEAALPSVFDLLSSQLNIPPIELPSFAGFEITNPSVSKLTGGLDTFLAINANLEVSATMRQLAQSNRFMAAAVAEIDRERPVVGAQSAGTARLVGVSTPPIALVRAALAHEGGALPSVTIDVDRRDAQGRELEWSWRLGNGMWRPYTSASPLVIEDRAFAWQGAYDIGLISRVKGQPATASDEITLPVVVDSVPPHVVKKKVAWQDGELVVPTWDIVGRRAVRVAFGRPGDDEPRTEWQTGGTGRLERAAVDTLVDGGQLAVFLADEQGNRTTELVQPFHGQAGASGCSCDASGNRMPGGAVLLLLTILGVTRPLRRGASAPA